MNDFSGACSAVIHASPTVCLSACALRTADDDRAMQASSLHTDQAALLLVKRSRNAVRLPSALDAGLSNTTTCLQHDAADAQAALEALQLPAGEVPLNSTNADTLADLRRVPASSEQVCLSRGCCAEPSTPSLLCCSKATTAFRCCLFS